MAQRSGESHGDTIEKVGGVLVEVSPVPRGASGEALDVVVGFGINLQMPTVVVQTPHALTPGALLPSDLDDSEAKAVRDSLAASVAAPVVDLMKHYPTKGFAPWRDAWQNAALWLGEEIRVDDKKTGTFVGIDDVGYALLQEAGESHPTKIESGTLRAASTPAARTTADI